MTKPIPVANWKNFASSFCQTQQSTPRELWGILHTQLIVYAPSGWVLLECADLSSSRMGDRTILPFGPNNTLKDVPEGPISPRGLASDMSTVIAVLYAREFPNTEEEA